MENPSTQVPKFDQRVNALIFGVGFLVNSLASVGLFLYVWWFLVGKFGVIIGGVLGFFAGAIAGVAAFALGIALSPLTGLVVLLALGYLGYRCASA
ncbi:MAG: hypothetical protein ABFC67_09645 [Mizugakiibacter sp.]|uniref:hypothetical protein n=1 Tax=Mizugakiibacter sp. TaxID=1972610 RepID=UPI0031C601CB|nr:hypothetical protein [Xanthomonadaceae bacterium]